MRKIDFVGKKFGMLEVISEAESKDKHKKWVCRCDCGKEVVVCGDHLKSGATKSCGCLSNKGLNLIGEKFGRLLVVEKADNIGRRTAYKCVCDCGNVVVKTTRDLRRGDTTSCGCFNKEVVSELSSLKLDGLKFGRLTVLNRVGSKKWTNGKCVSLWRCKCDCGNIIDVTGTSLTTGNTVSCGCLTSRGEESTQKYLTSIGVKYAREKTFDDLTTSRNGKPRFDFAILSNDNKLVGLIEYQGIQHYEDKNIGKLEREETDELKRLYCKSHNIPLLEIPYNKDLKSLIDEFLQSINYKPILCQASSEEG